MENFLLSGQAHTRHNVSFNVDGLAKLFRFADYVRAKSEQGRTVRNIVVDELDNYPYPTVDSFRVRIPLIYVTPTKIQQMILDKEPYISPVDLSFESSFHAAVTDRGVCQVFNGAAFADTYSSNAKNTNLRLAFDGRRSFTPELIHGTGPSFAKIFWLDVEDTSLRLV